ncbi:MAG: hypothetical protein N3A38_15680, partial [Planctomycetota bacterium]|nr:hypothetical protein [Planctomycetota bacterium]
YRGGLVVYLNGREGARAHVAPGVGEDDFAEGYPKGAYMPDEGDDPAAARDLVYYGMWTGKAYWSWRDRPAVRELAEKVRARRHRSIGPVEIPAALLRKGVNVLAVDARCAAIHPAAKNWRWDSDEACNSTWPHMWLDDFSLVSDPPGMARPAARPRGVQLWGEDIHRWIFNADFLEPGVRPRPIEIAGARGGKFSGQAVIGSDVEIKGLSAEVDGLAGPGGASIPSSAIRVRWGVPLPLQKMLSNYGKGALRTTFPDQAIIRYAESLGLARELAARLRPNRVIDLAGPSKLAFFDQLSDRSPDVVPPGNSQSVWLTVSVPRDAVPGEYRGRLAVRADGMPEAGLEVRLAVTGFVVPDPKEWTTFVAVEESPYSTAKAYGVPLWSEAHWKRVAECVELLGGIGNRLVMVPLTAGSEMGNVESIVLWQRKGEGYDYDWSVLDRYLDIAAANYGKRPAIVALVHPPADLKDGALTVTVSEGEAGAGRSLALPMPGTPEFRSVWLPFAKAFVSRAREKLPECSIHWGIFYDYVPPTLRTMAADMAAGMPDIGWMRCSHLGNFAPPFPRGSGARVDLDLHIRAFPEPDWMKGGAGRLGWNRQDLNLLYPREASEITAIPACAPLWHLRELPELALTGGARGFGRIGANYWDRISGGWFVPAVLYLLYPAEGGVEGSVQLEVLREGLQETEARIAIERRTPEADVLRERCGAAWGLLPGGTSHGRIGEFYGGWRERAVRLFEA